MCKLGDDLVSLTPPAVPMWGVFFEPGEPGDLLILPVMTLAMVEERRGDPETRAIRPLCFHRLCGVEESWERESEALGFILENEIPRASEIFAEDIVEERKKRAMAAE